MTGFANRANMSFEPETIRTRESRIACDGSSDIPAALGHPRVWLQIDERNFTDCPYCDRRFVLSAHPHDENEYLSPAARAPEAH